MDIELRDKVKIYIELASDYKRKMRFDNKNIVSLGALMSSESNKDIDYKKIKEIRKYIKKKTSVLSVFRGKFSKVFSTIMSSRDDYEIVFENTKYIYEMLLEEGMTESSRLLYAAFILAKSETNKELKNAINKFKYYSNLDSLEFLKSDYLVFAYLSILEYKEDFIVSRLNTINNEFVKTNIKDLNFCGLFYFALLISDDDVYKLEGEKLINKIEKALRIKCLLMKDEVEIDSYIYSLIGLSSNFVRDEDVFVREVNNIYNTLNVDKILRRFKFNYTERFKIALNIVLERYVEYIKGDIIDLQFNENGFIRIIEEYVMLSIGVS